MILNFIRKVPGKSNKDKDTIKTMCCLGVFHAIEKRPIHTGHVIEARFICEKLRG
jgi:hypothetical protein